MVTETINETLKVLRELKDAARKALSAKDAIDIGPLPEAATIEENTQLPEAEKVELAELIAEESPPEKTDEVAEASVVHPDDMEEIEKALEELEDEE